MFHFLVSIELIVYKYDKKLIKKKYTVQKEMVKDCVIGMYSFGLLSLTNICCKTNIVVDTLRLEYSKKYIEL